MADVKLPSTMRAWQYTQTKGGIENNLKLNDSVALPKPKADQHLIQVLATSLNPVDYKPAEVQLFHRFMIPKTATPGIDVVGTIVQPAVGSDLKPGQVVFGGAATSPFAGGAMAEYAAVPSSQVAPVPPGISTIDIAGVPVAALTAYQSIMPHIKAGSRVFLNGGSGGVGSFGIQIAKIAGAHVTVSCSTANVELCKSLGADDVVDYKQGSVLTQLQAIAKDGPAFDHVVDYVFSDPDLYFKCHTYTNPGAKFVEVAGEPSLPYVWFSTKAKILPGCSGSGQRQLVSIFAQFLNEQLQEIADWMVQGKIRTQVDQVFSMEQGIEAFKKSKTGRAKGKIVVEVAKKV